MTDAKRHNIWFPDDLWDRIAEAAAKEGAKRRRPMSTAEWIRQACKEKLERKP